MSDSTPEKTPQTQPASAGGPPKPPKKTSRGLEDGSPERRHIDIPDPVLLKDLASALGQKPFRIAADMMELGALWFFRDPMDFETAARVARKYGFDAKRAV